jgi:hypothetical protein
MDGGGWRWMEVDGGEWRWMDLFQFVVDQESVFFFDYVHIALKTRNPVCVA